MGDALTPPDAVKAQQQTQLQALLSLVPAGEGDEALKRAALVEKVHKKLLDKTGDLALEIADHILRLHEEQASGAAETGGVDS
eukprot:1983755-Pleurochrysis_carterae.AAC.1